MRLTKVDVWREVQAGREPGGEVLLGDARSLLPELIARHGGQVRLIYLDPPFRTGDSFVMRSRVGEKEWRSGCGTLVQPAFTDDAGEGEYMAMMREVLTGARELLTGDGSIYLHVDYRMHARLRLLMDELFGEDRFVNEIIWSYQTGGRARRFFSRKHDVILYYRKGKKYYFDIDAVRIPRSESRRNHMKRMVDADGRAYRSIKSGGKIYTYYDDDPVYPSDVWADVSHMQQKDPQRTGYDTQKPLRLLDRVVLSSSQPGDLVCDLFCGSGTTLESAHNNGRRFLGVDKSPYALQVARRRLIGAQAAFVAPPCDGEPEVEADLQPAIAYYEVELKRYQPEPSAIARSFLGLDAVDSWSVGYLRGGEFVAMAHDVRTRRSPALAARLELPVLDGAPCIRIGDVLGRYFYYTMEPGQRPLRE
ncbi:MAG: site-specific DNA-methyltransferase [Clostridiales bacterium]|nr:site-specific DNA-methyltransferase [Clostridiales bacterium]